MKIVLKMQDGLFNDLKGHLLPPNSSREEAAFLFAIPKPENENVVFEVIDMEKLTPDDFSAQLDDYLELADDTRGRLIKKAHQLGASLVEMHSHPGPWPAAFSYADRVGLKETVPHMWWRLPKRPYIAIVVAPSGFDALVWLDNPKIPSKLDGILAGHGLMQPTNHSLEGWK